MKKKRIIVTALLTLALLAVPASAKASNTISVMYQVDPSYEVVIPSYTDVPYLEETSTYGTIQIKEAILEVDKCILVEMNSSGVLINEEYPQSTIPYKVLHDNKPFTSQKYTKKGEETKLEISINKEDWKKAMGGTYKAAITFTISYVDK
ncbi:MAG: hypothetical protein ACI4GD_13125 [Lachnospiraceae bacterium]